MNKRTLKHVFKLLFFGCNLCRLLLICGVLFKVLFGADYVLTALDPNRGSGGYSLSYQVVRSLKDPAKSLLGYAHGFSGFFLG